MRRPVAASGSGLTFMPDIHEESTQPIAKAGIISRSFLFLRIFLFAAAVPFLMRRKLARVAALLEPHTAPQPVDPVQVKRIAAYVETAMRCGKPLVRSGCLTRGLTRYYFFRRAGLDVSLHFGMGRIGKKKEFMGHCWLVRDGQPYLELVDPRPLYTEMAQVSRESSFVGVRREGHAARAEAVTN